MQPYDFLMLFVLGGLTIYGYSKGMAWQVAYLTSFVASYFVAVKFSGQIAPVFGESAPWNKFVAMAAIYAGFSLLTWLVFRAIKGFINKVKLQSFDRQMGAMVGAARGVLWCVGITFFAVTLLPVDNVRQQVIGSQSGRYIAQLLDKADPVMPPEIHQVVGPHLNRLKDELNQPSQPVADGAWGATAPPVGGQPAAPGWPTAPAQGGQPSGWPSATTPPATNPWPTTPTSTAPPAPAWPTQPQPANPWPQQ